MDDEFVTCPYNASHRIVRSRIQHHLIKCQKISLTLTICPFNATHRIPDHMLKKHCHNCPNKIVNEPDTKVGRLESTGAISAPKPILQREYLPEEDPDNDYWDD